LHHLDGGLSGSGARGDREAAAMRAMVLCCLFATIAHAAEPVRVEGKVVTIDVSAAPELKDWTETKLLGVCEEWYPKIVEMLPSDRYTPHKRVTIEFRTDMPAAFPAWTRRDRISCNDEWFRRNQEGEAVGAVVHELVHVVQQYGQPGRRDPKRKPTPAWLVEGIADYIRWFKYEPETHGAEIRNPDNASYDASYRVTANFLNWIVRQHDEQVITKLNAALRQGEYSDQLWRELTGKPVEELGAQWKKSLKESQVK
jgi:hypothetical protein